MILAFFASFGFMFLRAIQQLNVQHNFKMFVVPTAMAIAGFEVMVVLNTVKSGTILIALPIGLGGGLGVLAAMLMHERLR